MRHRALHAVLFAALVVSAGCLGTSGGTPTPTASPTTPPGSPSESPTAGPLTPLPDSTPAFPDGPKERPAIPDDLSTATAASFAKTHERRWVYNTLYGGPSSDVSIECSVDSAARVSVGYRVVVSCTASATTGGEPLPNSTATSTVVHADWFTQTFVYLVDEDSVVRQRPAGDR
ncbi:hypothetical protein [Halobaculum sp. P14]|uniref:hypothetical protein n=1 Tax=Halobaculum sp. P14 TaxID=3421638 RepID=UPI003EBF8CDF